MLSIVIPTLNEEQYLPHLLDSLSRQTLSGFEIIVADAHSRPGPAGSPTCGGPG